MAPNFRVKPINHTYDVSFFNYKIHTTVTSDCNTVARWIKEIERPNHSVVGFDIQYSPWIYSNDFVSIVIFCVEGRCLIYQLEFVDYDYPDVLLDFLTNEEYTFVGLDISRALTRLEREHALDIPRGMVVELRDLTTFYFARFEDSEDCVDHLCYDAGLWELAALVLGEYLETESVMAGKWSLECLTPEQVKHATVEAFVSFEIGRILDARKYRLGLRDASA